MKLSTQILVALVLGVLVGLLLQGFPVVAEKGIKPFGTLFLNLIKMIMVPLVFSSLVAGACSLRDVKKLGRIGGKTLFFYLVTTAFAITIGLVIANLFNVGGGLSMPREETVQSSEIPSVVDTLLNIIPKNPVQALVEGNMLQIIAFALILGGGIVALGEKGQPLHHFFNSLAEVCYKITGGIMKVAPIGVFALITPVIATQGAEVLIPLMSVIVAVYLGCLIHAGGIYSLLLWLLARFRPGRFFKGIFPAQAVAFTTCSSSATLPINMKCTQENLGVSRNLCSFVLPFGATVNMDGTAIYLGVSAFFVATVYGLDLTMAQQVKIILTATLASIGTAGIPGAGLIMLTLVLKSVGLPLEGLALIAGIDRILDMARTTVNVTGDAACAVIIASSENELQDKPRITTQGA